MKPEIKKKYTCTGCDDEVTLEEMGGYREYCFKCVDKIPDIPSFPVGVGFKLTGKWPDFKWVEAERTYE